jgi:peptide/nickel transport system ATP-binding protein
MIDLLLTLQAEYGLSYLLITHNIALVEAMAHSVAVMLKGQIIEYGPKERVLNAPQQPFTQHLLQAVPRFNIKEETQWMEKNRNLKILN